MVTLKLSLSIAFNVNDDLSVSFAETEDTFSAQDNNDVAMKIKSMQVAYPMGAMSIKAYQLRDLIQTTMRMQTKKKLTKSL